MKSIRTKFGWSMCPSIGDRWIVNLQQQTSTPMRCPVEGPPMIKLVNQERGGKWRAP